MLLITNKGGWVKMKFGFLVSYKQLIHTFLTRKHAFEQGFLSLSTDIRSGYYYYLYIDKTHSQANPTGKSGLSNFVSIVKDFQLKKLRATA
jgi:hypothetical protein